MCVCLCVFRPASRIHCIIRFICHRLASWYFDLVTHWHATFHPTKSPPSSAKFEQPGPQPAFVCWHLQFIYSFRWCCCFCLNAIYFAPASTWANIAYTLYVIRHTQRCPFHFLLTLQCAGVPEWNLRTWEWVDWSAQHVRRPQENLFWKKKKKQKKYVVSPFEGVITRGDSLYSLDISCAKCFLPWWTQLSGEMGVRFISFNQLWCLLIK